MKDKSNLEILNDTNQELMNFYSIIKTDFKAFESMIQTSMHSRDLHRKAWVIYSNSDMFTAIERAWALWILAVQGFSGQLSESFGRDKKGNKTVKRFENKKVGFTQDYADRLKYVTLESRDAIKLISTTDYEEAFFYCDPPYYNSNMGHYDGYTIEDFELLLKELSSIKGKFLLSSYPTEILKEYVKQNGWHQIQIEQNVAVSRKGKRKTEVLTANYPLVIS